jgi:hypothetical protein
LSFMLGLPFRDVVGRCTTLAPMLIREGQACREVG